MEGESPHFAEPKPESETPPFQRVDFDGEHKIFVKECSHCGNTFSTAVPRKFFRNPDDESTKLRVNGHGSIEGYESIRADAVATHIFDRECGDAARHGQEERTDD